MLSICDQCSNLLVIDLSQHNMPQRMLCISKHPTDLPVVSRGWEINASPRSFSKTRASCGLEESPGGIAKACVTSEVQ